MRTAAERINKKMKILITLTLTFLFLTSPLVYAEQKTEFTSEQLRQGVEDLKYIIAKDPNDALAYQALGRILMDIGYAEDKDYGKYDKEAEEYLKKAIELNPKLDSSWFGLAILNLESEKGDEYLEKTIEVNPHFPEPYYWLGYKSICYRKDKEAIAYFKKYLEVSKTHPNDSDREKVARKILKELYSGEDGEELNIIRMSLEGIKERGKK